MCGQRNYLLCSVLILIAFSGSSWGANILGLFTTLSPSHLIIHVETMKTLLNRGHNITMVTIVKPPITVPTEIRHIYIPIAEERLKPIQKVMIELSKNRVSPFNFPVWHDGLKATIEMQSDFIIDERFTKLYNEQFDLLFIGYFLNLFELGFGAKFDCPIIMNWVGAPLDMVEGLTGNPSEMSYVPHLFTPTRPGEVMSFSMRIYTFCLRWYVNFQSYLYNEQMRQIYNRVFAKEKNFPSYSEMRTRISLFFSNYHSRSEGPIRPLLPSYIEVGGLQIKEKPDQLPEDLAEFLDGAKDGAVVLSLGSNVRANTIDSQSLRNLYNGLTQLKQRVIWKWDPTNTPGNASNILYRDWLPQDDLLAHPNVKLFITHAGKGGIAEGQYHGVPMLAFPFYGDQFGNAEAMVKAGFGLNLNIRGLQEDEFNTALKHLLETGNYSKNIKEFSKLYRDRPLTARQELIYWTEYVLRHKGALHLQSPVLRMNFIERNNLDIYVLFGVCIYLISWVIRKIYLICKSQRNRSMKIKQH